MKTSEIMSAKTTTRRVLLPMTDEQRDTLPQCLTRPMPATGLDDADATDDTNVSDKAKLHILNYFRRLFRAEAELLFNGQMTASLKYKHAAEGAFHGLFPLFLYTEDLMDIRDYAKYEPLQWELVEDDTDL